MVPSPAEDIHRQLGRDRNEPLADPARPIDHPGSPFGQNEILLACRKRIRPNFSRENHRVVVPCIRKKARWDLIRRVGVVWKGWRYGCMSCSSRFIQIEGYPQLNRGVHGSGERFSNYFSHSRHLRCFAWEFIRSYKRVVDQA